MRPYLLILALMLCMLLGCAPGLGKTLTVNSISVPTESATRDVGGARVLPFRDEREEGTVARIDGRNVAPEGDIPNAIRAALEGHLRSQGIVPRAFDVPSVTGSVEKWFVEVQPGFPVTDMKASASVRVEVVDLSGRPVFRKRFSGEAEVKDVVVGEEKVAEVLGDAMAVALSAASKDRALLDQILAQQH